MINLLYQSDVLSIHDISLENIQLIFDIARRLKKHSTNNLLLNKIIAQCFFEPSTRTRLSFESAALRLGGQTLNFLDNKNSIQEGESLHETIRVISEYADLIVIRHSQEGAARLAAEVSEKPVINAGDGSNEHPTQALVDLFTIQECQNCVDGLNIALVGDLKYGRTIHSLAQACILFDVRLYLVSPEILMLPDFLCDTLKKNGIKFSFHHSVEEIISKVDILYLTRIQQERFSEAVEYQLVKDHFILTPSLLKNAKPHLKVLHPLPRVDEIDISIDKTSYAHYFIQAANGLYIRQALLALLLNEQQL